MAFTLEYTSPASVDEALAAIKAEAAHSRESQAPTELMVRDDYRIKADISGLRFRLHCHRSHRARFDIHGYVLPLEDGGSRIKASAQLSRVFYSSPLLFLGVGLVVVGADRIGAAVVLGLAGAIWLLNLAENRRLIPGRNRDADHLASRLGVAMDSIGATKT